MAAEPDENPETLRVRDLTKPPYLEDWQWSIVLQEIGGLILARLLPKPVMVVTHCECCNYRHPKLQRVMKQDQKAIARLRLEISKQLGTVRIEDDEEPDPWALPADHWKG